MKPITTFEHILSRAERMANLHDGLVDTGHRRIRSDWKSKFLKFMGWPASADIDRIIGRGALVVIKDRSVLSRDDFATEALDDLLRSSLVMGVSALDRYVHERVVKGVVSAYGHGSLNAVQRSFSLPMSLTFEVIDTMRRAQRDNKRVRPANDVRNLVQEHIHKRTFQKWNDIVNAFKLIGVEELGDHVRDRMKVKNVKLVTDQLDQILKRRNEVVHEGDLIIHKRGGEERLHAIRPSVVRRQLQFLRDFVLVLDAAK